MVELLKGDGAAIMTVFIGAIIAATLIAAIATSVVGVTTLTNNNVNQTVTAPSAANASLDLLGRELRTGLTRAVFNSTNATIGNLIGLNFTLNDGVSSTTGLLTVSVRINDTGASTLAGTPINVSYTYIPEGTLADSGARSVTALITLFAALAIVVFIIVVFIKKGSLGELMKGS